MRSGQLQRSCRSACGHGGVSPSLDQRHGPTDQDLLRRRGAGLHCRIARESDLISNDLRTPSGNGRVSGEVDFARRRVEVSNQGRLGIACYLMEYAGTLATGEKQQASKGSAGRSGQIDVGVAQQIGGRRIGEEKGNASAGEFCPGRYRQFAAVYDIEARL